MNMNFEAGALAPLARRALAYAVKSLGPRRTARYLSLIDGGVAKVLISAERSLKYALPPTARTAFTAYLASASGISATSRLSNAACAAAGTADGLPVTLVFAIFAFAFGYTLALLHTVILPWSFALCARLGRGTRRLVLSSSPVRGRVDAEVEKIRADLLKKFGTGTGMSFTALPGEGLSLQAVDDQMRTWSEAEVGDWVSGRKSGTVYHGRDVADSAALAAFRHFSLSNPMHAEVFPAVRRMEAEVIAMTAALFHAPAPVGALTSGGTESIMMAVRAYRQEGRARGVERPNIVVPDTAHAAFDKAADFFCIEIRRVACDSVTQRALPRAMRRQIDRNTIALACSAVAFPHGTLDPVEELAAIAQAWGIGLHVDCCLGSFLLPFAEEAGFPFDHHFDFRVLGVSSISVDHHKYGLAPKGVSAVLFRSRELRSHMYTRVSGWTGGIYATATTAGSRPGALIAGAWAAMAVSGRAGYLKQAQVVLAAARKLAEGIVKIEGLEVVGEPALSVVSFSTTAESGVNVFDLLDAMSARNWELNALQRPAALHACVTRPMAGKVDELLSDLSVSMEKLAGAGSKSKKGESAALYGMTSTVPLEIVDECIDAYLDTVLSPAKDL